MKAMQLNRIVSLDTEDHPLELVDLPVPEPDAGELRVAVSACGVCHTELDEIEGRAPPSCYPMTPGHQVVADVVAEGPGCTLGLVGQRVGVAWIFDACGTCGYCREGRENLCESFRATGRDACGGYAEYMCIGEHFAHALPEGLEACQAAPLLCAGAVGFRALSLCELRAGEVLGLTGFGASGHLVLQMARALHPDTPVCVFARNPDERQFALELGADWAGDTRDPPPLRPNAMVDTTPAWLPVIAALDVLAPGGRLVINAIRKESRDQGVLASLDYERHLWREKSIRSVANVTRADVRGCLDLAAREKIRATCEELPLEQADEALERIRQGGLRGAFVLRVAG